MFAIWHCIHVFHFEVDTQLDDRQGISGCPYAKPCSRSWELEFEHLAGIERKNGLPANSNKGYDSLCRNENTMKLDKIYTRTGDDGRTSLGDGTRIPKFRLRVDAYGSIDEANSVIGIAKLHVTDAAVGEVLGHIQNDLFDVGADLCRPEKQGAKTGPLRITDEQVSWLESRIDHFNADLAPLDSFVLPGGSHASAYLHHARTVTRRAERLVAQLASEETVNPAVIKYVNRLSDLFFVLARFLNDKGKDDVRWKPGLHR
jgi:cob(I)alamin adenosyltransferase